MATRLIVCSANDEILFSGESSSSMRAAAPVAVRPTLALVLDDDDDNDNDTHAPESGVFAIESRPSGVPPLDLDLDLAVCG